MGTPSTVRWNIAGGLAVQNNLLLPFSLLTNRDRSRQAFRTGTATASCPVEAELKDHQSCTPALNVSQLLSCVLSFLFSLPAGDSCRLRTSTFFLLFLECSHYLKVPSCKSDTTNNNTHTYTHRREEKHSRLN